MRCSQSIRKMISFRKPGPLSFGYIKSIVTLAGCSRRSPDERSDIRGSGPACRLRSSGLRGWLEGSALSLIAHRRFIRSGIIPLH